MTQAQRRKSSPERRRTREKRLAGVCGACGKQVRLGLAEWQVSRREDRWPGCRRCGSFVYPVTRRCKACGARLRNGNLGDFCALCERKRVESDA